MKCPMQRMTKEIEGKYQRVDFFECTQEECAWWDFDQWLCGFRSAQMDFARIRHLLADILDKMPHENQFRK